MKRIFYLIKPLIPRKVQLLIRRKLVARQREKYKSIWPILSSANKKPDGWPGWPDGKSFAFVLTHDVELQGGHDKCKKLLQIEQKLGFKSSFNFVPERYIVSAELRNYITNNGFEVGVHGLKHDGKLFKNRDVFSRRAKKINKYILDWNADGFRAPSMHHNLEWISELNIKYDLSTFDTDPFEPQSDGVGTIFPFWVKGKGTDSGYVELPYTLVQDFTLFILMNEQNCDIWKEKLDWIVAHGGMALVNVHPDYINFENNRVNEEFPVSIYYDFLNYVKEKYRNKYWNALPREIAHFYKNSYQR